MEELHTNLTPKQVVDEQLPMLRFLLGSPALCVRHLLERLRVVNLSTALGLATSSQRTMAFR